MKRFDPLSYLENLKVPTLIIDAEEESLFDREKMAYWYLRQSRIALSPVM